MAHMNVGSVASLGALAVLYIGGLGIGWAPSALQPGPLRAIEGGDIGSERAFAARKRLPVIGKIDKIHADHQ